jgi:hypothetical protein
MTRRRRASRVSVIVLAVASLVSVAGCDVVFGPEPSRSVRLVATPEPTVAPTPTESDEFETLPPDDGNGPSLTAAADALADLDSYRVTVSTRGLVTSTTAGGMVTMTSTVVQGEHPAAAFTMAGVDGFSDGRLDAIVIGDEAWLKEGSGRWRKSPGGAADFDAAFTSLSPPELASTFEGLSSTLAVVGKERRDGQSTDHLRARSTDTGVSAAGLTTGSIDLWRATSTGALVALVVNGTWTGDDGAAAPVVVRIDVSHVNDPANHVAAPG